MKTFLTKAFFITFLITNLAYAQDNKELQKMADDDQDARFSTEIDWKVLNTQDSIRRARVNELFKANKIITAKDYFNAGIIFQHGNDTIASRKAVEFFGKAIKLDSSLNRWWYAAAVDRDLMRRGQPQIYGTQIIKNKTNNKWKRYKMDTTKVTDVERLYYGVETLAQQRKREKLMNLKPISSFYSTETSVDKLISLIKAEFEKGEQSEYNITEAAINKFGYELMNNNYNIEALEIFKLNTTLHPNSYNTYDSYGECLLKLNKTDKGLKAYKKSLELNPYNENAKQVLSKFNN